MCPVAGNGVGSPSARSAASDPDTQLQSVAFNPRLRNTVAFSDSNGNVKVWKLTWKLSNMKPGEERALSALADIAQQAEEPAEEDKEGGGEKEGDEEGGAEKGSGSESESESD